MPFPLCLWYCSGVLFGENDRNTQQVQRMVALEFFNLILSAFLQTVCHGIAFRYHGGRLQRVYKGRDRLVPLNKRFCTLFGYLWYCACA